MVMECEGRLMNVPFTYGITHCRRNGWYTNACGSTPGGCI
jgi:hypothetical protein